MQSFHLVGFEASGSSRYHKTHALKVARVLEDVAQRSVLSGVAARVGSAMKHVKTRISTNDPPPVPAFPNATGVVRFSEAVPTGNTIWICRTSRQELPS